MFLIHVSIPEVHCRLVLSPNLVLNIAWIPGNSSIPTQKSELFITDELHRQCTICYCTTNTYCNNCYCRMLHTCCVLRELWNARSLSEYELLSRGEQDAEHLGRVAPPFWYVHIPATGTGIRSLQHKIINYVTFGGILCFNCVKISMGSLQIKGKVVPMHTRKAYGGNGGTGPLILKFWNTQTWAVSTHPGHFTPKGKEPPVPI
jgi:hypothetical protein